MIIGPNAVILGYVLKSIPNSDFRMADFGDRHRLQKLIYMVEAFGVYLGYDFSWYLRGPYCTNLARTGFELEQIVERIPQNSRAQFLSKSAEKKFDRCVKFISSIMDDPNDLDRLEIAASIHLLAKNRSLLKEAIFERVISKMPQKDSKRSRLEEHCQDMWDKLDANSLIPGRQKNANSAHAESPGLPENTYRVACAPGKLSSIKEAMTDHQQYGDIAIAVTLKDLHDNKQDLEPNNPPAFVCRPNEVEQLIPDSKQKELITFVLHQYG